jgi:hypothetical protein
MTQSARPIASDHPIPVAERAVLNRLLDLMIPASFDGALPSAGSLDLYADTYADRSRLGDGALVTLREGLRALAAQALDREGMAFVDLDEPRAMRLVDAYRNVAPGFFGIFVTQSAARYYQHDRVMIALGLEPRPPWPAGNAVTEGDWSLLDAVRERARAQGNLYREV